MKKLLPQLGLLCLLLLPLLGWAQEVRISGRVVDAVTKMPVPFASLGLRDTDIGALSNEEGYFQMEGSLRNQQDSLICMTLGYCRKAVLIKTGQTTLLQIEMEPRPFDPVIKTGPCGVAAKQITPPLKAETIDGTPGTQYAFLIKGEKGMRLGKMRTVSFFIGENGFPRQPFRVHIYGIDGASAAPSFDILTENVLYEPLEESGWYTKDLSAYDITTPKKGYFVALEFATMDFHPMSYMDNYIPSGLTMRPPFNRKEQCLWSRIGDENWKKFEQSNSGLDRYRFMVKIEVELLKQKD